MCGFDVTAAYYMVYAVPTDAGDSELPRFDDGASEAIPLLPSFRYLAAITPTSL